MGTLVVVPEQVDILREVLGLTVLDPQEQSCVSVEHPLQLHLLIVLVDSLLVDY